MYERRVVNKKIWFVIRKGRGKRIQIAVIPPVQDKNEDKEEDSKSNIINVPRIILF